MTRVVVLAGPSGAGKSRLAERAAERLGAPVLRLDDFYRSAGDPALPLLASGPNAGLVDWDDPASWRQDEALDALETLCRTGAVEVPTYDIARSARVGSRVLRLDRAPCVLAEGIFAHAVVEQCRARGILGDAVCVTQHPALTFARRLVRDLREHRKPPLVLVRRGLALARAQRAIVDRAVAAGCTPMTGDRALDRLTERFAGLRTA